MTLLTLLHGNLKPTETVLTLKAVVTFGDSDPEGRFIEDVSIPWFQILQIINNDPSAAYKIDPHKWEEIVAGAYKEAGYDEVILTPRSGDKGRDVVATKNGVGSIRIFDQVKAYKPGHLVTADEVRALLGVIGGADNVSKGVVTTTSSFAPKLAEDPYISKYLPYRLELKAGEDLFPWLEELRQKRLNSEC
jgi:restriction system protein